MKRTQMLVYSAIVIAISLVSSNRAGAQITLHRLRVAVKGHVVDSAGHIAANAKVTYVRFKQSDGDVLESQSLTSDARGDFNATIIQAQPEAAEASEWIAEKDSQICVFTASTETGAKSRQNITLRLVPEVRQSIRLTLDGVPAAHVNVAPSFFRCEDPGYKSFAVCGRQYQDRWNVETGDDGIAVFEGLPLGYEMYLNVSDDRYARLNFQNLIKIEADTKPPVGIALEQACSIVGRVTHSDGTPAVGATCRASTQDRGYISEKTDDDGNYRIGRIPPAVYSISALDVGDDWVPVESASVSLIAGQSLIKDITVTHGAYLTGRVVDAATGKPAAGLNVHASDQFSTTVLTDTAGVFHLRLSPGHRAISVYGPTFLGMKTVDAVEGGSMNVEFKVAIPAPIKPIAGIVVDSNGKPVPGVIVDAASYNGELRDDTTQITDGVGRFQLPAEQLASEVAIVAHSGSSATVRPTIAKRGSTVTLRLVKASTVMVRGMVRDRSHHPLPGVDVQLVRSIRLGGMMTARTKTDAKGSYRFTDLAPGMFYSTFVSSQGYTDGYGIQFKAQPGQVKEINVEVDIANSSVVGVVLHSDGKPYTGIQLHDGATFNTTATTDSTGHFELKGVPRGPSKLFVLGTPYGASCNVTGGQKNVKIVVGEAPHPAAPYDASRHITARYDALVGTAAPEFAPAGWMNSPSLALKSLRGKVVLVAFWQNGCAPCCANLPTIEGLWKKYRSHGLVVIGMHAAVNQQNVKGYAAKHGYDFPIAFDTVDKDHDSFGKTFSRYTVDGLPCVAVIDAGGRIVSIGDETPVVVKTVAGLMSKASRVGHS